MNRKIIYGILGVAIVLAIIFIGVPAVECVQSGGVYVKGVPWYTCIGSKSP